MSVVVITPPTDTPVSVEDAKAHLRVDGTEDDDYIGLLIEAATAALDGPSGRLDRCLMPQTLELRLPSFWSRGLGDNYLLRERFDGLFQGYQTPGGSPPISYDCSTPYGGILLPCRPIISITSATYIDTNGAQQTVDPALYELDDWYMMLAYGQTWPSARFYPNAVRIRYQAGYSDADAVPSGIKHAIKMMVAHWYQNREAVTDGRVNQPFEVPHGYEALLAPYRVY